MSNSEPANGRCDEESPTKTESLNSDEDNSLDKDSPAFRLRPRRSTPRPSSCASNSSPAKKYAFLSTKESPVLQPKVTNLKYKPLSPAKRKLFRFCTSDESEEESRFSMLLCPTKCVLEDINVSAFAERLMLKQLERSKSYESNYVFVRIVYIFDEEKVNDADKMLKLLVQEADGSCDLGKHSENVIVKLFGHYSNLPNIAVGKFLQIFKFKTEEADKCEPRTYSIDDCDIETLPLSLIIQNTKEPLWIPFVSIKSIFEPPADNSILLVNIQKNNNLSSSSSSKAKETETSSSMEKKASSEANPVSVSIKQGNISKVPVPVPVPVKNQEVNFKTYSGKLKDVRQVPAPALRGSCVKSKATSITITSSSVTINSKNSSQDS